MAFYTNLNIKKFKWLGIDFTRHYRKSAAKVGMFCELADRKTMSIFQKNLSCIFTHTNVDKL